MPGRDEPASDAMRTLTASIDAETFMAQDAGRDFDDCRAGTEASSSTSPIAAEHEMLLTKAVDLLAERQLRHKMFCRSMFGETAWDILLAVYIRDHGGAHFTLRPLARRLGKPLTSIVRWLGFLTREELIERLDHPTDGRQYFIALSPKGASALEAYLASLTDRPTLSSNDP